MDLGSFTDTFPAGENNIRKTADLSSSTDTFRLSEIWCLQNCGPWQFYGHILGVDRTADLSSSMETNFDPNKTGGPKQFYGQFYYSLVKSVATRRLN